jgi:hypothetical protein
MDYCSLVADAACICRTRVICSGVRVPFLTSESGSLQKYTNQSQSLLHFAAKKEPYAPELILKIF